MSQKSVKEIFYLYEIRKYSLKNKIVLKIAKTVYADELVMLKLFRSKFNRSESKVGFHNNQASVSTIHYQEWQKIVTTDH